MNYYYLTRQDYIAGKNFGNKKPVVVVDETGFDVVLADLLACSSVDHIHPHLQRIF